MVTEYNREKLMEAAGFLPRQLRWAIGNLSPEIQSGVEEIRLRSGRGMTVVAAGEERSTGAVVTAADLELTLEMATQSSAYAVMDQIKNGFVALRGGHRLGLCGTGVIKDGRVANLRQLSSMALRVAHQVPRAALPILPALWEGESLCSTLIISPPGRGKTTLLRDLVRCLSDGVQARPMRVGLADERGELAAMSGGRPQMDVGLHTDVMDGCPKGEAMLMLLRGMAPQVLAVDEVTSAQDVQAMETATGCGVVLLATAHAGSLSDLSRRPLYRRLLEQGIFRRAVTIGLEGGQRRYQVYPLGEGADCGN